MPLPQHLARMDLNLLVALQALLQERNVTRAAERLHITQPAMSKTLQRLRETFDDPLFMRTAYGLVPTPRAEQMELPLSDLLETLESTLFLDEFDPKTAKGIIHIATPETVATAVFPRLIEHFVVEAPGLQLKSYNVTYDYMDAMSSGAMDIAIYLEQQDSEGFYSVPLPSIHLKTWVNKHHPLAQQAVMSVEDFCRYPHISLLHPHFNDRGNSPIDLALQSMGMTRHVILQTSQLMLALEALNTTDAILLSPDYIANYGLTAEQIVHVPVANETPVFRAELPLYLVQHQRTKNSPLHRWMAEKIIQIFEEYEERG